MVPFTSSLKMCVKLEGGKTFSVYQLIAINYVLDIAGHDSQSLRAPDKVIKKGNDA